MGLLQNERQPALPANANVESSAETKTAVHYALAANLAVAVVQGIAGVLTAIEEELSQLVPDVSDVLLDATNARKPVSLARRTGIERGG
jgi:hypothetical protein